MVETGVHSVLGHPVLVITELDLARALAGWARAARHEQSPCEEAAVIAAISKVLPSLNPDATVELLAGLPTTWDLHVGSLAPEEERLN